MKKILLSLFALVAMSVNAQTYLWQEDFSSYKADAVPAGGTYSYVCTNGGSATKIYDENLAGGTKPELLVGKTNGAFAATVALNGTSGEATLSFQCNRSITVTLSDGATLGKVTPSGNNYSYPVTIAEGTENVTITFKGPSKNARLDDIKFFQGQAKKAAGLSWGTASRIVTLGATDNTFPTLTNANNLEVTYSSDKPEVATIAADGTVTLVAAGTANISAVFAGNDEYEAQTVSYALTVQDLTPINTAETAYTVAEAVAAIDGEYKGKYAYVKGTVSKVDSYNETSGSITYWISDDGTTTSQQFECYNGLNVDKAKFAAVTDLTVGDKVVVLGQITKYNDTYEFSKNNVIVSIVTTALNSINAKENGITKFIENGQIVIFKGGKKYNVAGAMLK